MALRPGEQDNRAKGGYASSPAGAPVQPSGADGARPQPSAEGGTRFSAGDAPVLPSSSSEGARAVSPRPVDAGRFSAGGSSSLPRRRKRSRRGAKPHKQGVVKRMVVRWCNRLLAAVSERSLSEQEAEFAEHRTTRDYVCNSIGIVTWGAAFPVLTIVATQLVGVELAGMFSIAFITAQLLMFAANYGVRTYQVSDIDEEHTFLDYQVNRWVTCVAALVAGVLYANLRGYAGDMFVICMGVYVYKIVDGLADVYEGRLQQADKFYLAGVSQAFRSVAVLVVFSVALLLTRNLPVACVAMGVAAVATFVVLTFPLAVFETPKSRHWKLGSVIELLKRCFPLFVALFMFNLIESMPKFVMEGTLGYDSQLYFNALYFPAQFIVLGVGVIYKPLLVRMATIWADPAKRRRFDLIILMVIAIALGVTALAALFMGWIGISLMGFMYGVDFEQFRGLALIMVAAGGVTAVIDFLYQVITVLRMQHAVTRLYLITFGFSVFVPLLLVTFTGLPGAVIGYLIVMCILLVLLVGEYVQIRGTFAADDERRARRRSAAAPRHRLLTACGAGSAPCSPSQRRSAAPRTLPRMR